MGFTNNRQNIVLKTGTIFSVPLPQEPQAAPVPPPVQRTDLDDAVDAIIDACNGIPEKERKFFEGFNERMVDFRRRLHSNQIRIAVIGITSSGKSTLLNSLLGCDLLPTRAAPSSGRQVLCGYADSPHAEILFEDKSQKTLVFRTIPEIKRNLEKYGDEKNNPGNQFGVKEIHVFSRDYRVDHDLLFVDTPGLDAYELEYHEKITLNLVLPTVDMVLYLTTTNDSDQKNREYINSIDEATSSLKPLILVQNKIDTVRPKQASRGVVKTSQEVRREFYNKLKRLLEGANNKSVRSARIVQVSAKGMLGFDALKDALSSAAAGYRTRQGEFHRLQFNRELKELEQKIRSKTQDALAIEATRRNAEGVIRSQEENINRVGSAFRDFEKKFAGELIEMENIYSSLLHAIDREYAIGQTESITPGIGPANGLGVMEILDRIGEKHFDDSASQEGRYSRPEQLSKDIENRKTAFESKMDSLQKLFFDYTKRNKDLIHTACGSLNLDEKQVYQVELSTRIDTSIPVCTVEDTKTETILVEKHWLKKILDPFGLFTDDYDYKTVSTTVSKTVVHELRNSIHSRFCALLSSVSENYKRLGNNMSQCSKRLQDEVAKKKRELENQFSTDVSSSTCERVLTILHRHISTEQSAPVLPVPGGRNAEEDYIPTKDDDYQDHAPDMALYLFQLAQEHMFDPHKALVRDMIERSGKSEISICAWNDEIIQDFENIFIPEESRSVVHRIDLDSCTANSLPGVEKQLVFLLLNAGQSGSAQSRLYQPGPSGNWLKQIAASAPVVWCMDSVRGAVEEDPDKADRDHLMEVFHEMERIVKDFHKGSEPFDIMALDEELSYSVLLHELHFHAENWKDQKDKEAFIENMSALFHLNTDQMNRFGQYLNLYLNMKQPQEESTKK